MISRTAAKFLIMAGAACVASAHFSMAYEPIDVLPGPERLCPSLLHSAPPLSAPTGIDWPRLVEEYRERYERQESNRGQESIQTSRLLLRSISMSDLPALNALLDNPEVGTQYWLGNGSSAKSLAYFLVDNGWEPEAHSDWHQFNWTILEQASKKVIGFISAERTARRHLDFYSRSLEADPNGSWAELSYAIDPAYQGAGFGTEALRGVLSWKGFPEGVRGFFARPRASNTASRRLLEKAGFREMKRFARPESNAFDEKDPNRTVPFILETAPEGPVAEH